MFPNLEGLSVEQLIAKQLEIKEKMMRAHSTGMSSSIIDQMQNMLEYISVEIKTKNMLEQEQQKRERAIEDGRDPDEDNVLNIGDVE